MNPEAAPLQSPPVCPGEPWLRTDGFCCGERVGSAKQLWPMLPIGVVLPTRNAAPLLPEHLAAMRSWAEAIQEIVVVDSLSTDGTLDLIEAGLHHPRLRILKHPPGLYQSWNFGIEQLEAEYCYISTVGESISLEGLQHLADVMGGLRCDVVVSRPKFVDIQGQPMQAPGWPIDDILKTLRLEEPVVLEGAGLFLFALVNYRDALLGSSASNLYRTRCLESLPFPLDYGTAGDGGWGLANCLRIRLGVTPQVFSTFREHPKSYARSEYAVEQLGAKMFGRVCQTFREGLEQNPAFAAQVRRLQLERMIHLLETALNSQQVLERCRHQRVPWILNPSAWQARRQRNLQRREIDRLKTAAVRELFDK